MRCRRQWALPISIALALLPHFRFASARYWYHPIRPVPTPIGCTSPSSDNDSDGVSCPVCEARPRPCRPRVRRNWSSLDDSEKKRYINAMHVLKWTPTERGRELYGKDYVSYDELVLHHATADVDPRGDQAHQGQHFAPWHVLFMLNFENSLLSVDPEIGGSPYWDMREGTGAVFGSSEVHFGSATGFGDTGAVGNGAFSNWTVAPYDERLAIEKGVADSFGGDYFSDASGAKRMRKSDISTASIIRYGQCRFDLEPETIGPPEYSESDYNACLNNTNFADFYWCLESPHSNGAHELTHLWLGSMESPEVAPDGPCGQVSPEGRNRGDYNDRATGLNDPIFYLHHTYLVMMFHDYMRANPDEAANYWGYQAYKTDIKKKRPVAGTLLDDTVNAMWPFTGHDLLDDPSAPQGPLKYWEVMCWVGPTTSVYTYDVYQDPVCEGNTAPPFPTRSPTISSMPTIYDSTRVSSSSFTFRADITLLVLVVSTIVALI